MQHFSKRSTPIMAEEARLVLGLGPGDYRDLLQSGRLAQSLRPRGDPAGGAGPHSFWDLLGCDLWRLLRRGGLSEPLAALLAAEVGDLLAEAEDRPDGPGGPARARLHAHPVAGRLCGRHDALLGATIGALRRTHDLLRDGPPRPGGTRLLATLPGDGPLGARVLEMALGRPGPEGGRWAPRLANR